MIRIVFDPWTPLIDYSVFRDGDWSDFFGNVVEEDPPDMPALLGNPVNLAYFVDTDHVGNKVTHWSHTGIIPFLQNVLIQVFSNHQNTCISSSYGSELVALCITCDLISAMCIKLKCFGVPIIGPCSTFCDNMTVVKNTSIPESVLAKNTMQSIITLSMKQLLLASYELAKKIQRLILLMPSPS